MPRADASTMQGIGLIVQEPPQLGEPTLVPAAGAALAERSLDGEGFCSKVSLAKRAGPNTRLETKPRGIWFTFCLLYTSPSPRDS